MPLVVLQTQVVKGDYELGFKIYPALQTHSVVFTILAAG